jgi:hypothetical protein
MKKPHPREYGFDDVSGVQLAIEREEKRKTIVTRTGRLSFWAAFLISVAPLIGVYTLLPHAPFSIQQANVGALMAMALIGFVAVAIGIGIGLFARLGARIVTDKLLQPSLEFLKARQYINADRTWKKYVQQEYGYDS